MTPRRTPSDWQRQFQRAIAAVSDDPESPVRLAQRHRVGEASTLWLTIDVDTSDITREEGGLRLNARERIELLVPAGPNEVPHAVVRHTRFVGFPHVLHGQELCIYLDPAREWDPLQGAVGYLNRLWGWLVAAAGARFSASESLYHAVGGVPVASRRGSEMLVVRGPVPNKRARLVGLHRTPHRIDIKPLATSSGTDDRIPIVYWPADGPLPLGPGATLATLLHALGDAGSEGQGAFCAALVALSRRPSRLPDRIFFIIAVPHPAGGPAQLIAGNVDAAKLHSSEPDRGYSDVPITWNPVSDEREEVTTRRDSGTPAAGFSGARVVLFGTGALGSWMAEFIVRAGARSILLFDPGWITGGLLVRQDFAEADVGQTKSSAMSDRLRAISDSVEIVDGNILGSDLDSFLLAADYVIDATASVSAAQAIDPIARSARHAVRAQVAIDAADGSRGIATIAGVGDARPLPAIDGAIGSLVKSRADLESYHIFWRRSPPLGQVLPTRGCSTPTFHGAAANIAAAAGTMVSLLGRHRGLTGTGSQLFTLPIVGDGSAAVWIPATE